MHIAKRHRRMNRPDTGAFQLVCQSQNYGDIETCLIATSLREEGIKENKKKKQIVCKSILFDMALQWQIRNIVDFKNHCTYKA